MIPILGLLTFPIACLKSFRFRNYPLRKVLWGRPSCRVSYTTKNSIWPHIKSIPMHPYFICIGTIITANTVIHALNIGIFNLAKTILMCKKKYVNDAILFTLKIRMKSINTTYKKIWMVKVFPRNIKRTCSAKHCKI